ncbi:MAG: cob(I)yrinic acid a,c-diamide adenosyltransferase [Treponema sp.]|nr:cob(I)yrinic acid a,c-diamide adenosyltransferase [Treponema sp.]
MSIYTGKGDNGETSDLAGKRLSKNDIVIHFLGALDELNSNLGLIRAMLSNEDAWQVSWLSACQFIELAQKNLVKLMSHVSDIGNNSYFFSNTEITGIEKQIYKLTGSLPKLTKFVIPGKNIIEAQIQIARTIARRAERYFFAVNEKEYLCREAGVYLNRLSDYLFVLSQQESLINDNFINQITGI